MTQKDYILIARVLNAAISYCGTNEEVRILKSIENDFVIALQHDNTNFNVETFRNKVDKRNEP